MREVHIDSSGDSSLLNVMHEKDTHFLIIDNVENINKKMFPDNDDILGNYISLHTSKNYLTAGWYEFTGEWHRTLEVSVFKVKIFRDSSEYVSYSLDKNMDYNLYKVTITIYKKQFDIYVTKKILRDYNNFLELIYNVLDKRYRL